MHDPQGSLQASHIPHIIFELVLPYLFAINLDMTHQDLGVALHLLQLVHYDSPWATEKSQQMLGYKANRG